MLYEVITILTRSIAGSFPQRDVITSYSIHYTKLYDATVIDGVVKGISLVEKLVIKDSDVFHGDIYRVHLLRRMIMIEDKLISFFTENPVPGIKLVDPEKWDVV